MALTGKKKLFADAVLGGKSNKDAAIAAGYSAATASAAGSRLVKDGAVVEYLAKCREAAANNVPPPSGFPAFDLTKALQHSDPKMFLLAAMNDVELEGKLRIDAAKALMPFVHPKVGEAGKKDQRQDAAKKAGAGKFAAAAPPKLVVNNRK
jgi:phage terminase small subunit